MTISQVNQWLKAKKVDVEAKKVKKITNSFTNDILRIKGTDNKLYKLRLANENPYINRKLEFYIEKSLCPNDFLYYNPENGNYVRTWYVGKHPTKRNWNQEFYDELTGLVNKYQSISIPSNINLTYPKYFDDVEAIKNDLSEELKVYKDIIKTFKDTDLKLSHNDLSCNNMIISSDGTIHLYDFEWSTYNHRLWDICNMIKDLDLSIEKICTIPQIQANVAEYTRIIYAVHFYTLFWTYRVEETKMVIKYRAHILKRLQYWFNQVKLLSPSILH